MCLRNGYSEFNLSDYEGEARRTEVLISTALEVKSSQRGPWATSVRRQIEGQGCFDHSRSRRVVGSAGSG